MKRILYTLSIAAVCTAFVSCEPEQEEMWKSATFDYAGRFVVAATCDEYDGDDYAVGGHEIEIYNSAANVADEIWIEGVVAQTFKGKFKLSGSSTTFKGVGEAANIITTDIVVLPYWAPLDPDYADAGYFPFPEKAGEFLDGLHVYRSITLEEGKILPKAGKSIGGNTVDSVYLRFAMHSNYVRFISYEVPEGDRSDPDVPEFWWKIDPTYVSPDVDGDNDEHWTLTGFRYTGYPEDM
jgi:hypothetical protein